MVRNTRRMGATSGQREDGVVGFSEPGGSLGDWVRLGATRLRGWRGGNRPGCTPLGQRTRRPRFGRALRKPHVRTILTDGGTDAGTGLRKNARFRRVEVQTVNRSGYGSGTKAKTTGSNCDQWKKRSSRPAVCRYTRRRARKAQPRGDRVAMSRRSRLLGFRAGPTTAINPSDAQRLEAWASSKAIP
jgi:hypothetical protein